MRPVVYTLTDASGGAKTSPVCPLDHYTSPFNVSLQGLVSGTVTYTVEYTFDDVFATSYNPATGNWTSHPGFLVTGNPVSDTRDDNLGMPATGVRLKLVTGTGSVRLTIIQAGGGDA